MCHVKNLSAYKTSEEILMELNTCSSCPSVGSLITTPNECLIFQGMLKRYTAMIQREYFKFQKEHKEKEEIFKIELKEEEEISSIIDKSRSEDLEAEEVACEG